jgi:hypothetical protein
MLNCRSASPHHVGGHMALRLRVYLLYFLKYVKHILVRPVLVQPGSVTV